MSAGEICGYDSRLIYISLHLALVCSTICLSLFINSWISQGTNDQFWKGSLFALESGLEQFSSMQYDQISEIYCAAKTSENINNELFELYSSRCEMFSNLDLAGRIYIFFEVFSLVSSVVWIATGLYFSIRLHNLNYVYSVSILPITSHSLGYYIWAGIGNVFIASSCKNSHDGMNSASVCGDYSALLAYGVVVLNGIVVTGIGLYVCFKVVLAKRESRYVQEPLN